MQKITPYLWFDNQAEEAMNFYLSVFKDAKPGPITRFGETGPLPAGTVWTASFEIMGMEFIALNGGPQFSFTPAISLFVHCKDQAEVDEYWAKLTEDGEEMACGWVTDKFGITWQIIPDGLVDYIQGEDPEAASRAMQAMLQMKKIDLDTIRRAYLQE